MQCTLIEKSRQAGGVAVGLSARRYIAARARVSAGLLRGTGYVVRRAAASDGAREGAGAA